ncbi:MAG: hypothetical protein GY754_35165 [bacterium]|nr:hypothetical protein [bacterium]
MRNIILILIPFISLVFFSSCIGDMGEDYLAATKGCMHMEQASITVDASTTDWTPVALNIEDADEGLADTSLDIEKVKFAVQGDNLFFLIDVVSGAIPVANKYKFIFKDIEHQDQFATCLMDGNSGWVPYLEGAISGAAIATNDILEGVANVGTVSDLGPGTHFYVQVISIDSGDVETDYTADVCLTWPEE